MIDPNSFLRIADDVKIGPGVQLHAFVNLYGCSIGDGTRVGAFVEIQRDVVIGSRCKISSHSFICSGVTIEDEVFIGHHVCFTNDRRPRAASPSGGIVEMGGWACEPTIVRMGASIGSGAVILPGIEIGKHAEVGAGSVVTKDVAPGAIVVGNPARVL